MNTVNLSVDTLSGDVVEKTYGSSGLSRSGPNIVQVFSLLDNKIFLQDISLLKWVDLNSNGFVEDGEIVLKTSSEIIQFNTMQRRLGAKNHFNDSRENSMVLKSILLVMVDEINLIRNKLVPVLPARTFVQVKTAIENKIDSGSVD